MHTLTVPISEIRDRLDASYYEPEAASLLRKMMEQGPTLSTVDELASRMNSGPFGSSLLASEYVQPDKGVIFFRPVDCKSLVADDNNNNVYISYSDNRRLKSSSFTTGSIIVTKIGNGIGDLSVVPASTPVCNISGNMMGFDLKAQDPYFISAYFHSRHGAAQIRRSIIGGPMPKMDMATIGELPVPLFRFPTQTYIGDKVRQAERLQARAQKLEKDINSIAVNEEIAQAIKILDIRSNRIKLDDIFPRLDPKYYGSKALAVYKACQLNGTILKDLITGISNGFEERTFVENGRVYITVSEVSSGRLNIENAPKIDFSLTVPAKAIVHERCALVVRTGSIGNAVKVFHEDSGVSISSHLIRLEFDSESYAAVVAAFLNSEAGKILQQKISYGAVQPQIGQEELVALPIPNAVLNHRKKILCLENDKEQMYRSSSRIITAAKLLVESLIEGHITESDLIAAQKALEAGDRTADREILSRLTRKGMNVMGEPPLFPDLDKLYEALDELDPPEDD